MVHLNRNSSGIRTKFKRRRLLDEEDDYIEPEPESEQNDGFTTGKSRKDSKIQKRNNLVWEKAFKSLSETIFSIKTMIQIWSYELCPLSLTTMKEFYEDGKYYGRVAIGFLERLSTVPSLLFRFGKYLYQGHWQNWSWTRRIFITVWFICQLACFWQKYQAGILFFTISLLILITTVGLDHGEIAEGSVSAYSVFNKGCQRLLGTYNVEEWERLIRHTPPAE